jgi:hypothetical protein
MTATASMSIPITCAEKGNGTRSSNASFARALALRRTREEARLEKPHLEERRHCARNDLTSTSERELRSRQRDRAMNEPCRQRQRLGNVLDGSHRRQATCIEYAR